MANHIELEMPWSKPGNWYKANLHTHTTCSDGARSPDEMIQMYADGGYDVLVLTDHGRIAVPEYRRVERLLQIPGMELDTYVQTPHPGTGWHIVGFPCTEELSDYRGKSPQEIIDFYTAQGAISIIAHPYWLSLTCHDLLGVKGYTAIEVWNGTCDNGNSKACSSVIWDDLLYRGHMLGAVGVDDCHIPDIDFGQAWTWIKAEAHEPEAIIDALRRGSFYASQGPNIYDLHVENGYIHVQSSPAARVNFIGQMGSGFVVHAQDEDGLTSVKAPFPDESYAARVEVVDAQGRRAWANPIRK